MHTVADPHQRTPSRPRHHRRRGLPVFLLILTALLFVIVYPPTFLYVMRQVLSFEAWRYGFHLSIGSMDGSITDPIWLYRVRLAHNSATGTTTMVEIDKARTGLEWRHLFWQRDARIWHDLMLDGVRGSIDLPLESAPGPKPRAALLHPRSWTKTPRLVLPSSLEISHASLIINQKDGSIRLDGLELKTSDAESGQVVIGALSLQEPWVNSIFSNCRGVLALEDSNLILKNMKLTDALSISTASADLPELLRGQLQMQFALDAFSGNITGELTSGDREQHLQFESSGAFSNISVAQLAAFLGEDADGLIKEGKFTFRGSPRNLEKATFTTRFEAGNFRWGARRWNSLTAGATYVNHRLLIPEFQLRQAHNSLMLKGDMSVPEDWKEWWKTDFNFTATAKIDNLTELSALLGPGFGDISGKLTMDGSVRGENALFNGQLIVSGSRLSFRKAPLDELQAAIKLQGNEIQVANAEITHGDDFLRAHGVVNILGEKRYWGEVKASIADLSLYASFLQPPIVPEALGGGLMLDWSGDGAAAAHSGAFSVRLNRIHPLVSTAPDGDGWQPIDLNAEGTYSPDSIFFSNLTVDSGETTLASRVTATPRSLTLQDLKLVHGKSVWLTGDAQIPLNVWAAWQEPATSAWWNFESPCKLDLKVDHLSVHDTLLLSGRQQPFEGELTGNLKSDGTLAKLTTDGHLSIKNVGGTVAAGTLKGAEATVELSGSQAVVTAATGEWNEISGTTAGTVTASDVRVPSIDLTFQSPALPVSLGKDTNATVSTNLHAVGQLATLALSGSAELATVKSGQRASIEDLVTPGRTGLQGPLPVLAPAGPPAWKLDVRVGGLASVTLANTSGKLEPALQVSGSLGQPIVSGSLNVRDFTITQGPDKLVVEDGTVFLDQADPTASALVLHATGVASSEPFDGYIYGTVAEKHFTWGSAQTAALAGSLDLTDIPSFVIRPFSLNLGAVPLQSPLSPGAAPSATPPTP